MTVLLRLYRSVTIGGCAALVVLGGVATSATAATPAQASSSSDALAAYDCSPEYFCIYDGWNGTGHRCQWSQSKVSNTANDCSWIRSGALVRSVYNRTDHRVQYYTHDNYNHRVGSTPSGGKGSLEGTYQIRSFQPQ